ncbi:MAG: penicillin-binding protein 2 [Gemmatimonadota bacterium]|nr:penicillin-binding protein 2 [Gemmatimonadota bacterium]
MNGFDSYRMRHRADAARWVLVAAFAVLLGAFFRTQVVQHDKYQLRAETNRLRSVPITPPRGMILDRNGKIIAENVPGYAVKLLAQNRDSLRAALARLAVVIPLDSGEIEATVRRFGQAPYQPVTVIGDAPFDLVSRLEEHRAALPGLVLQAEPKRYYPAGSAVAHLVGYVGEVTDSDLEAERYPGAELGAIVGKSGLERQYDSILRGRPGVRYIEVNARNRLVREDVAVGALPPEAGDSIRTTIDLDLQLFIDSIWPEGVRGSMVALSPKGEVLALYSAPAYDPNDFVGGIPRSIWASLNTDSALPLLNRAIQTRYPPASPFKLATAAMALKRGIVSASTRMPIPCRGGMQFGNRYWRCWKREGHGNVDLIGAVAGSCDVYFYQLGLRLGVENLMDEGHALGFGDESGIDLGNEKEPIYPSEEYLDRLYGPRRWSRGATALNLSIGQGENTQTVINMVKFYQGLTSGVTLPPYIVRPRDSVAPHDLGLTPDQLRTLRMSMIAVLEGGTGSASRRFAGGLRIGGKTGTAQNPHGKDHGWFLGFAPAEDPEIIVGSIMEFYEHGSTVAPFVVQAISRYLLGPQPPPVAAAPRPAPVQVQELPADSAPRAVTIPPDSSVPQ